MSMDREQLETFLEAIADRYTATELVDVLEEEGLVDVWKIIAFLEEEIIEARLRLTE
jgi:hypothetical protein